MTADLRFVWTYRRLFGIAQFRALFCVRLLTMISVVVSGLALGTVVFAATDSPVLTAVAMFGGPLVQLLASRYLLAGSDLMRPRTAIVLVGVVAAATDALQLIPGMSWGLRFVLLAAGYVAVAATSGTTNGLLSQIVPEDGFVLGRATLNITVGGMQVLGNAVGAALLLLVQPVHLFAISACAAACAALLARACITDMPPRANGRMVSRTREMNRALWRLPQRRLVYLMMWVPNGLIVGCEALFIPYAGHRAGYLFATTAAGMLAGDIVIGRFSTTAVRARLVVPLRLLLAAPFLVAVMRPPVELLAGAGLVAAFGYTASLPLQERLLELTSKQVRGQAFGLAGTGLMAGQSLGALLAGALAGLLGHGIRGVGWSMAVMAVLSICVTLGLATRMRRRDVLPSSGVDTARVE